MTMQTLFEELSAAHAAMTDYWYSKRNGSLLPSRRSLNPCDLRRYLSHLSIIELTGDDCSVRLSGTGVHRQFGLRQKAYLRRDLRLIESNWWLQTALETAERAAPSNGVRQTHDGDHVWLRLPFEEQGTATPILVCHDYLIPSGSSSRARSSSSLQPSIAA